MNDKNAPEEKKAAPATAEVLRQKIKVGKEELIHLRQVHALSPLGNTSLLKKKKKEIARYYTQLRQQSM